MTPAITALGALVVSTAMIGFGALLVEAVFRRHRPSHTTVLALAFPAVAGYTLLLMLLHILSGGRVFASPWLVRILTITVALVLVIVRPTSDRSSRPWRRRWMLPASAIGLGLLAWGSPVARMLVLDPTGDTMLHTGWAAQLMNGEALPSAPITGDIPNFYPWFAHALMALLAHLTPGGRIFHALSSLQLLLVMASVLAFFALGREIAGRRLAGWTTALFGAISGGVGFLLLRGPDVVLEPRDEAGMAAMRYLGDLLFKRSYNIAFNNLSPPFARDVALVLLVSFLVLLVIALRSRKTGHLLLAGSTLGLIGLTGAETFFLGVGVAVVAPFLWGGEQRLRSVLATLIPAGVIFLLWALPLALNYLRLGFVNITLVGPITLPTIGVLGAWGASLPAGIYGSTRWVPRLRRRPEVAIPLAILLVAGITLIGAGIVPRLLGEGFLAIGRRHRYWPMLHLGVTIFAGLGLAELVEHAGRISRRLRMLPIALALALSIPSPLAASLALPDRLEAPRILADAAAGDPGSVLNVLAPRPGLSCTVAVPLAQGIPTFSYTGYRMVMYVWSDAYITNKPRLRWKRIWDQIVGEQERLRDNEILVHAQGDAARWRSIAAKYDVDLVVVPTARAQAPALHGLPILPTSGRHAIVRVQDCGA